MKKGPFLFGLALAAGLLAGGCATTYDEGAAENPDEQLAQAVRQRLQMNQAGAAYYIGVSVNQGIVTLDGAVPNAGARMQAVGIARSMPGVRDVVDKLRSW